MNTLPETEQHYQQLLKANPNQAPMWCLLGETRQRLGKLAEATAAYQNALRLDPASADGHFGLAGIYKEQGQRAEAILSYRRGLANAPDHVEALLNLGVLLAEQGQLDEALGQWQRLLRLRPDHAQAHQNVGVALAQKGQHDDAIRSLERALELKPDYAEACCNLANVLCNQRGQGSGVRGQESGGRDQGTGVRDQGTGVSGQGRAVELLLKAVRFRAGYIDAYHNLGAVLTELGRPREAEVWLRQAVRLCEKSQDSSRPALLTPDSRPLTPVPCPLTPSAYNQLGLALMAQSRYARAEVAFHAALRHNPAYAEAHSNLGNLFQEQGRLPEALASYELALVHDPQSAPTHWNRSLSQLQSGDFEQGWREYEWRWRRPQTPPRPFRQPRWDGSPLEGRTLLIYMEQGLGDMLQFIRYAAVAKGVAIEKGVGSRFDAAVPPEETESKRLPTPFSIGRVLVECPPGLVGPLGRCRGIDQVVAEGSPLPGFEVQAPLMSLPGLCGTTLGTVPAEVPYLFADERLVCAWRERLGESRSASSAPLRELISRRGAEDAEADFLVGIVWQGNPRHRLDRYRSAPLAAFAPLARVPRVRLVSLQKEAGSEQIPTASFAVEEPAEELDADGEAFADTAAIMMNLDLVISVDTAIAHLAGALGVPVWVPLSAVGEWRWLIEREDTPWYPTMRLFRQKKLGQWGSVFRRMSRELTTETQRHRAVNRDELIVMGTP